MPKPSRLPMIRSTVIKADMIQSKQRQSKKNEVVRIQVESSIKKPKSARIKPKKIPGTVSALQHAHALTLKKNVLVIDAAQLMASKRCDCVLVVDEKQRLCGIFTAKDLAYRVVANNLDARATPICDIMTEKPMCVTLDTPTQSALDLMVSRGFRHLPVCNEEGEIYSLLDITKCIYESLHKMENAYSSSQKLCDALKEISREWVGSRGQLVEYMDILKAKSTCPNITSILDRAKPVKVTMKTQVRDVTKLMKESRTTAVLVMDRGELTGIFTSKDIVFRVIACGITPDNCTVSCVMTPRPDTVLSSTSILDALQKMHNGHYLNLPVLDENKNVLGLIDVLQLTYAALEQINTIKGKQKDFWNNITPSSSESTESDSLFSETKTQLQPQPLLTPEETATNSTVSSLLLPQDDGMFFFKFHFANRAHRFRHNINDFLGLLDIIHQKMKANGQEESLDISVSYLDDDNDKIIMTCTMDLLDSVRVARKAGLDRVTLFVFKNSVLVAEEKKTLDYMLSVSLTFISLALIVTLSKLSRR